MLFPTAKEEITNSNRPIDNSIYRLSLFTIPSRSTIPRFSFFFFFFFFFSRFLTSAIIFKFRTCIYIYIYMHNCCCGILYLDSLPHFHNACACNDARVCGSLSPRSRLDRVRGGGEAMRRDGTRGLDIKRKKEGSLQTHAPFRSRFIFNFFAFFSPPPPRHSTLL